MTPHGIRPERPVPRGSTSSTSWLPSTPSSPAAKTPARSIAVSPGPPGLTATVPRAAPASRCRSTAYATATLPSHGFPLTTGRSTVPQSTRTPSTEGHHATLPGRAACCAATAAPVGSTDISTAAAPATAPTRRRVPAVLVPFLVMVVFLPSCRSPVMRTTLPGPGQGLGRATAKACKNARGP